MQSPPPPLPEAPQRVVLTRCRPDSEDAAIVRCTEETIAPLQEELAQRLAGARTIAIKINAGVDRADHRTDGRQNELTDPAVVEGTIRALRRVTDAELLLGDAATEEDTRIIYEKLGLPERLQRYPGVRLIDFNQEPIADAEMTHSDPMFRRYMLPRMVLEADAVVSVAKMKAHMSLGCTLSIKNLFGWIPTAIYGAPRMYLHDRLIRLPRVLADLALHLRPCLCVVDGTVATSKQEWGGEALRPGVLLVGTNAVATDSVGARVMGFDPDGDYPEHPFLYRRNLIRLVAQAGLGSHRPEDTRVIGPAPEDVLTPFEVHGYGNRTDAERIAHRNEEIRRGAACVARYQERQSEYVDRYGSGRLLALYDGEVLWDGADMVTMMRLAQESKRDWRNGPQILMRCLPPDEEIEVFAWYAREAENLPDIPPAEEVP